jgi:hypothetical protein
MKMTLAQKVSAVLLACLASAASASPGLIICAGGRYCEDVRIECLADGGSAAMCERLWRLCVLDACPQR